MIRIFAGYDPNEAAGYATFCHSVITRASQPVSITPIIKNQFPEWQREGENNGATEFSFARFLVPYLCGYRGHAIFMDGADMLCLGDIAELWAMRDHSKAVQVVQHPEYDPQAVKMWGQENRAYPRKNWSSVMIMNCEYHHSHLLTPENVATKPGHGCIGSIGRLTTGSGHCLPSGIILWANSLHRGIASCCISPLVCRGFTPLAGMRISSGSKSARP